MLGEGSWGRLLEPESPLEQRGSSKYTGFSLAEYDRLPLAGLLLGQEETFLFLAGKLR